MNDRAGYYVSNLSGAMEYKSFCPSPLPPNPAIEFSQELVDKLVDANKQIAELKVLSTCIPNIELFVLMYVRKEALLSSQIEGTQCTLDDILDPNVEDNTNLNVSDVVNYIKATEYALDRLQTLPLCNRLIKETHAILLEGVRGQEKSPGEFRYTQNWIGGQGSTIKNARYIPPNPEDMNNSMSDLEKYINSENNLDPLIQVALIHYQFETIHPFLDGNGRIGRLLITLFLIEKKLLSSPCLYISYFLKLNRIEYYDRMMQVRSSGNYEQWVGFFLEALSQSAQDAILNINKLTQLHDKNSKVLDSLKAKNKENIFQLFTYIEKNPIIDIQKTARELKLSYNTVAKIITLFLDNRILSESKKRGKTHIYSYEEYLNILRKDT